MAEQRYEGTAASTTLAWFNVATWSAVFAGLVVAMGIALLLAFLGIGIGLTVTPPTGEALTGLSIGAGIWWLLTGIISLFIGGWVAGRLAKINRRFEGALHGLVVWGLQSIIVVVLITTTLGMIVGGALGVIQASVQAMGEQFVTMAPEITTQVSQQRQGVSAGARGANASQQVMNELEDILAETLGEDVSASDTRQLERSIQQMMISNDRRSRTEVARQLSEVTGMSQSEANMVANRWSRMAQQTSQQISRGTGLMGGGASQVAEQALYVAGVAGWWAFFTALLSGIAAAAGGLLGVPGYKTKIVTGL